MGRKELPSKHQENTFGMSENQPVEMKQGKKLALRRPLGTTALLGLLVAAVLIGVGELLLRQGLVSGLLPAPSFGINHQNLDLKFAQIVDLKRTARLPSCILLGASVVDTDIDPERFSLVLEEEAGLDRDCYNFGIGALVLPSTLKLTEILDDLADPELIIYGVTPLDFNERFTRGRWQESQERIENSHWLRYRLGEYSRQGWLIDHSWLYRYFLRFRQWMDAPGLSDDVHIKERSSVRGFNNHRRGRNFEHTTRKIGVIRKKLEGYEIAPRRIELLGEIAAARSGRETVFVETPLHPEVYSLFPGGEGDYRKIMDTVSGRLMEFGVPLVRIGEESFAHPGLWRDYYHLNHMGALRYTDWLGSEVGEILVGKN